MFYRLRSRCLLTHIINVCLPIQVCLLFSPLSVLIYSSLLKTWLEVSCWICVLFERSLFTRVVASSVQLLLCFVSPGRSISFSYGACLPLTTWWLFIMFSASDLKSVSSDCNSVTPVFFFFLICLPTHYCQPSCLTLCFKCISCKELLFHFFVLKQRYSLSLDGAAFSAHIMYKTQHTFLCLPLTCLWVPPSFCFGWLNHTACWYILLHFSIPFRLTSHTS